MYAGILRWIGCGAYVLISGDVSATANVSQDRAQIERVGSPVSGDNGLTELVVRLAKLDLFNASKVSEQLRVSLSPRSSPEPPGWVYFSTSLESEETGLMRVDYRQYFQRRDDTDASGIATNVALKVRIRDDRCYTGDELVDRYFRGTFEEFAKSQNIGSYQTVWPLNIDGEEVLLTYQSEGHCVRELSFTQKR
jgi:hypothetical protein